MMMDRKGPPGMQSVSRQEAVRRLKESVSGHRTGLPKKLLDLFAPREDIEGIPPAQKKPPKLPYTGLAQYVNQFAEQGDPEYEPPPPEDRPASPRLYRNLEYGAQARINTETKLEKDIRLAKWKTEETARILQERVKAYDPSKDKHAKSDPYKTIFVARLSYDVTEKKLRREFEEYGAIKSVRLIEDKKSGKPKGYAFIEYEHKNDFKTAYKTADGRRIEGRRVLVDCERGRTVDNWRPRRLGGGLGGETRLPKEKKKPGTAAAAPLIAAAEPIRSAFPDRRDNRRDEGRRDDRGHHREERGYDRGRDVRKRERSPERFGGRDEKRRHFEDGEVRDGRRGERRRERDMY